MLTVLRSVKMLRHCLVPVASGKNSGLLAYLFKKNQVCMCTCLCIYVCMCVYMYVPVPVCMRICVCAYIYACMCVFVCECLYVLIVNVRAGVYAYMDAFIV